MIDWKAVTVPPTPCTTPEPVATTVVNPKVLLDPGIGSSALLEQQDELMLGVTVGVTPVTDTFIATPPHILDTVGVGVGDGVTVGEAVILGVGVTKQSNNASKSKSVQGKVVVVVVIQAPL
jgi:hypothetical protein